MERYPALITRMSARLEESGTVLASAVAARTGALAVVISTLHLARHDHRPRLDILGMLLLAAASACIVLFSAWGGTSYAWHAPVIIGLGAGFVVLAALFLLAERHAAEPIIPLHLFRSRTFTIAGLIGLVLGVALFGAVSYLGFFLQTVDHLSATVSGLLMLPFVGGLLVSSIASGRRGRRVVQHRPRRALRHRGPDPGPLHARRDRAVLPAHGAECDRGRRRRDHPGRRAACRGEDRGDRVHGHRQRDPGRPDHAAGRGRQRGRGDGHRPGRELRGGQPGRG